MANMKYNIPVGRADTDHESPSHVSGVRQGNATGNYAKQDGHNKDGTASARRSTGINPGSRDPIMKEMPKLTPA
jgi:hypothetical protein